MHKPLSYFVYIKNNKRKTLGIIISIALGIFLIAVIQFYTNNMTDTDRRGATSSEFMSQLWGTKGNIPEGVMKKVVASPLVEKAIKVDTHRYMINNIIGSDTDYTGYDVDENNMKYIMDIMGLKLRSGEMPKMGEKEIIINENVARARNLKIGDYMGSDVTSFDWFNGKYKICGIIKGDNIISFIPRSQDEIKNDNNQNETFLIIPKSGKLNQLNIFLKSLPKEGIGLYTYDNIQKDAADDSNNFNTIFNIVIIVMVVVLSVSLGNSAYVHYYQRRMEFGLLAAIGFNKTQIILRAFTEIFISCLIGFVIGLLLIQAFCVSMNSFYLYPHGLSFFSISASLIIRTLAIPIFICIFSLIPTSRLLSMIEPISIIERNE